MSKKPKNHSQNYISIPEYAKQLGISRIAVYKRVKNGSIPAKKVGRNYVINVGDAHVRPVHRDQAKPQKQISIPQYAKELGISRIAVYQKVKNGEIPAEKIGRNYVINVINVGDAHVRPVRREQGRPVHSAHLRPQHRDKKPITKIKKLISIPELAKQLGISRIAVYKKVKCGQIEAKKIGRNYSIVAQDVFVSMPKDATRCEECPKDYKSIPQLAKEKGVSRFEIYNKVKKGEIKAEKVGRNFVINVGDAHVRPVRREQDRPVRKEKE